MCLMLELVLVNAASHTQRVWNGALMRIANMEMSGSEAIQLSGDTQHKIDFSLSTGGDENTTKILVQNHGASLVLPGGQRIPSGMQRELALPTHFWVGSTHVSLSCSQYSSPHDPALVPFPSQHDAPEQYALSMKKLGSAPAAHTLAHWLATLSQLQQSVAGSQEFFQQAAYALFDPGGLDASLVLLIEQDQWRIAASHVACPGMSVAYRRDLLQRALTSGRTYFHDSRVVSSETISEGDAFVVVAPLVNRSGSVIGALYGIRHDHAQNQRRGIRPLEAQFVQAVADTVSAGMQRLEKEAEAAKLRARLEQVFSPTVARELERNPRLLEGDQREITVLFADLRGFTSLSEQLSPRELYQLLSDMMDRLTAVVMRYDGILIDYYGDGFSAFWNAPIPISQHAWKACSAAQDIQRELEDLNADWQGLIGRRLRIGIGIHTGLALVGNAGSQKRIKYGPRGATVNLAARIENATKHIGLPVLLSAETHQQVNHLIPARRVFRQSFEGIGKPVDLFQPLFAETKNQASDDLFEQALQQYEAEEFENALRLIEQLRSQGISDAPLDHLHRRVREKISPDSLVQIR
jgi:adenylate cyclase